MSPAAATPGTLLRAATQSIDRIDAEWLLLHVLRRPRSWLLAHRDEPLSMDAVRAFEALTGRRACGEPVAYLTGRRGFWSFDLDVDEAVLIPRPETELLVELALARLPPDLPPRVADLGTGSGAIALAIARERPDAAVIAVDASAEALVVAQRNARRLAVANIVFRQGDWFAPLSGERFELIVSNPPYIAADDPHLGEGDLRFEPAVALASGEDGLQAIREIVRAAPAYLARGGWLLLEHGWQQASAVRTLLAQRGFADVATRRDLGQRERVTLGRLPPEE